MPNYDFFSSSQNAELERKKLLNKRRNLPPVEIAVYKNEELEKALRTGNLEKYKVQILKLWKIRNMIKIQKN